jgi:LDH2 family malate/lactate/ureidoglycolate dehydrogenase
VNFSASRIREQIVAILTAWKMNPKLIDVTAEVMVDTDLAGVDSHGVSMLILYEERYLAGTIDLKGEPRVVRENAVTALIDAAGGLGHYASVMAMRLAIDKAAASGIGAVSVTNSNHFGAAGNYAKLAAQRGFIGLVTSNARTPCVVPTRSSKALFGTNPIAIAVPARRNHPFLLDMATSTVAANKVRVYEFHRKPLPDGWVLDDSSLGMDYIFHRDRGGLTPVGGIPEMSSHKGYGLAMVAQILGATLCGADFWALNNERGVKGKRPDNLGHFFLALDPKAFRTGGSFEDEMDDMIDLLHAAPPIDPALPVLVPGDPEVQARECRLKEGIPMPSALIEKIRGICQRSGAAFLLDSASAVGSGK